MSRDLLLQNIQNLQIANPVYKILNKNSISPTIIVLDLINRIAYKIWCKKGNTDYEKNKLLTLDYERKVYSEKIRKLVNRYGGKCPILPSVGEYSGNIETFLQHIGAVGPLRYPLLLSLYVYYLSMFSDNLIYEENQLKQFVIDRPQLTEQMLNTFSNFVKIEAMSTLMIDNSVSFMNVCRLGMSQNYFAPLLTQIVLGIFLIYNKNFQHNDLHPGNILVANNNTKIQIYDWDFAYIKDNPNPALDTNACGYTTCPMSSCNILFPFGYSIDFFRIMSGIAQTRPDYAYFLENVFGVLDWGGMVHSSIFSALTKYSWFRDPTNGCNYLVDMKTPEATLLFTQFGSIDTIFVNMKSDQAESLRKAGLPVPEAFHDISNFRNALNNLESDDMLKQEFDRLQNVLTHLRKKREISSQSLLVAQQMIPKMKENVEKLLNQTRDQGTFGNNLLQKLRTILESKNENSSNEAKSLMNDINKQREFYNETKKQMFENKDILEKMEKEEKRLQEVFNMNNLIIQSLKTIENYRKQSTTLLDKINFTMELKNTVNSYITSGTDPMNFPTFNSLLTHPEEYKIIVNLAKNLLERADFSFTAVVNQNDTNTNLQNEKSLFLKSDKSLFLKSNNKMEKTELTKDQMLIKLNELSKIPQDQATYEDLFLLRYLTNYLKYGPPKPAKDVKMENKMHLLQPKPSYEIMFQKNEK